MRALIILDPYATNIVEGRKKIEYRTRPTKIRERIGIIRAGSKTIIGEVDLVDCTCTLDDEGEFCWHLRNPYKYKTPKPYKHPRGAQVWVNIT